MRSGIPAVADMRVAAARTGLERGGVLWFVSFLGSRTECSARMGSTAHGGFRASAHPSKGDKDRFPKHFAPKKPSIRRAESLFPLENRWALSTESSTSLVLGRLHGQTTRP